MTPTRLVAAIMVVLGSVLIVWHLSRGADPADASRTPEIDLPSRDTPMLLTSSADCASCHREVYEEWMASHHRIAYENPEVQRLSNGFQEKDCLPCHLPRPILETGLAERPIERGDRFGEGVDCLTCHFHSHGNVMLGRGPLTDAAKTAPCQPAVSPVISDMKLCAPCHNQHKVKDDWSQSAFAVPGPGYKDCNDCHFPKIVRASGKTGRDHRSPGAHDDAFLKTAATIAIEKVGAHEAAVTIVNDGTGHNFPADERHRAVDVELRVRGRDGEFAQVRVARFRNPYRQEFEIKNPLRFPGAVAESTEEIPGLGQVSIRIQRVAAAFNPERQNPYPESTQIPAGESRVIHLKLPGTVMEAEIAVYYRLQPYETDEEASLLATATLRLD